MKRRVGMTRVHMEEDTGKTTHAGEGGRIGEGEHALVDYNRAGIPLVEVVSEPEIASPEEARAYLAELRTLLLSLGVSDVRMEEGSLRCDANVSVRPKGATELGVKVEVKNMNSMRSVQRALALRDRAADRSCARPGRRSSRRRATSTRAPAGRSAAARRSTRPTTGTSRIPTSSRSKPTAR